MCSCLCWDCYEELCDDTVNIVNDICDCTCTSKSLRIICNCYVYRWINFLSNTADGFLFRNKNLSPARHSI